MRQIKMMTVAGLAAALCIATPDTRASDPAGGGVTINGVQLFHAVSSLEATVDVVEYREGSAPNVVRLIPEAKRYEVCIRSKGPVKVLDSELPLADTPDRFTVGIEDGRELTSCLLAKAKQIQGNRLRRHDGTGGLLYKYCLRCEDISAPAP